MTAFFERYDQWGNLDEDIKKCMSKKLHLKSDHPIGKVCLEIEKFFKPYGFSYFPDLSPFVRIEDNFDDLLVPWDHISRDDAFTIDIESDTILRTHTTAHQRSLLKAGHKSFIISGDVYRREDEDKSHYPCFYQCDGAFVGDFKSNIIELDLKSKLESLIKSLIGNAKTKWVETYYKFADPSWEVFAEHRGQFIEILGCGLIRNKILDECNFEGQNGWAFGIGIDRLAMIMYDIEDIRLLWEEELDDS